MRNKTLVQRKVGLRSYEAALYRDQSILSGGEEASEIHGFQDVPDRSAHPVCCGSVEYLHIIPSAYG